MWFRSLDGNEAVHHSRVERLCIGKHEDKHFVLAIVEATVEHPKTRQIKIAESVSEKGAKNKLRQMTKSR